LSPPLLLTGASKLAAVDPDGVKVWPIFLLAYRGLAPHALDASRAGRRRMAFTIFLVTDY
jgi:hypothetical protein